MAADIDVSRIQVLEGTQNASTGLVQGAIHVEEGCSSDLEFD